MRKLILMISMIAMCSFVATAASTLEAFKAEAANGVAGNVTVVDAEQDEEGMFVTCMKEGFSYQFTISNDMESGVPDSKKMTVDGRQAEFFDPGMMGAKGLLVALDSDRSLVVLVVDSRMSGKEITLDQLRAVIGRMNLGVL